MKALIIEDEYHAARRLKKMISTIRPDMVILDVLDSVRDCELWFKENPNPDLVFMDIQLADGVSFSIFQKVNITAPVIFTTAFHEYSLKAFKVNSVDYLLKPIDELDLENAINKYEKLNLSRGQSTDESISSVMKSFVDKKPFRERFLVKIRDKFIFILADEVAYFYSEESVSFLVTRQGKSFIFDNTLSQLESELDPTKFFRINRKQLVHFSAITSISSYFNNRLKLDLQPKCKEEALVSREKVKEFKLWLGA